MSQHIRKAKPAKSLTQRRPGKDSARPGAVRKSNPEVPADTSWRDRLREDPERWDGMS